MRATEYLIIVLLLFVGKTLSCQNGEKDMNTLMMEIKDKEEQLALLYDQVESIKLHDLHDELIEVGVPEGEMVSHSAMILSFDPDHMQSRWVCHVISPEIMDGRVGRTNDFRDDPLVLGEAVESDYFLKELLPDSSYKYDGFGYDRGHLAPSADFAWSPTALSESYFYSNMSPMDPDFNREDWAEMEAILRGYVWRNEAPLYVVTLPLIQDGYEVIERGVNKLPIPQRFVKVALDIQNQQGIAFVMPNRKSSARISEFVVSIDRAEEITGFDFYGIWDDERESVESEVDLTKWFPESIQDGVEPLNAPDLPAGHINTTQAERWMGSKQKVSVCGTVVSTRFSGSGNYWVNLDKKFPNTVFSVYIRKDDFKNFDRIDKEYLLNEKVCFHGKVTEMFSQPNMNIIRQEQVIGFDLIKK